MLMPVANCPYCVKKLSMPNQAGEYDCPKCGEEFGWDGKAAYSLDLESRPWYQFPHIIVDSLGLTVGGFKEESGADEWWGSVAKCFFLGSISILLMVPFLIIGSILGLVVGFASSSGGTAIGALFSLMGLVVWVYFMVIVIITSLGVHWRRANGAGMSGLVSLLMVSIPVINFAGAPIVFYRFGWGE